MHAVHAPTVSVYAPEHAPIMYHVRLCQASMPLMPVLARARLRDNLAAACARSLTLVSIGGLLRVWLRMRAFACGAGVGGHAGGRW